MGAVRPVVWQYDPGVHGVQSSARRTPVAFPNDPTGQASPRDTPTTQYDPAGHATGVDVAEPHVWPDGQSAQSLSLLAPSWLL